MALFDGFFGTPEQTQALGLLGQGLMRGDAAGGFAAAGGLLSPENRMRAELAKMQLQQAQQGIQKGSMDLSEMQRKVADEDATRQVLQGIYSGRGMPQSPIAPNPPGAAPLMPGASPASVLPASSLMPSPSAGTSSPPAAVTPKAEVWQQYKAAGDALAGKGLIAQAQQYWGLAEKSRPKYGTEPRVMMGPNGLVNVVVAEDGSTQVLPFGVKPAMKTLDLGGKLQAVDENALTTGQQFGKTMTPGESASNALGWANNGLTRRGQDMTDARARDQANAGKAPAGYRMNADGTGLEYIPGGPADPNAAKKAAPTEFQGKSTTYAARMEDAAKVIDKLQPEVSSSQVARAGYSPEFPTWMPGGQVLGAGLSAANKITTPDKAQLYRQAQENWVTANLRQESGAAIGKDEMAKDIAKWFPQPGEPQALIDQKAGARKVAERAMLVQAGPGATSIPGIVNGAPANTGGATGSFDQSDPLGIRK